MTDVEKSIVSFIEEMRDGAAAETPIRADTKLIETGVLDSMGLVRLIQFVEQQFGITIPDADVTPDLFNSPSDLAAYVVGKQA
jgi:acyl carrier protein